MRKIALLAALFVTFAMTRPAAACRGNARCPVIIDVFAGALAITMAGGYAYGTGYFAYHDLTDETQTIAYGGEELAYNALFGSLFTYGAVASARDGSVGGTLAFGTLGLAHDVMALHGAWRIREEWKDPGHAPAQARTWIAGIAYGANTLVWTAGLAGDHGRTYGIVEAGVNGPIALGLGYLAFERAQDHERGATLLYGGMALVSGALAYHGIKTAISPPTSPGLDLLGSDLIPVAVSDGRQIAPGLAMSGTW